mmetsp:Transcript_10947/g.25926  ORF Transcript_10947/g.25926 Transcript_10947/m.25926 type:complete len:435 (+) Transcript_10947:288-1592(+)
MMEMIRMKKDGSGNVRSRSRSHSRERVSLLGTTPVVSPPNSGNSSGLRGREQKHRTRAKAHPYDDNDEERASLLIDNSPGKFKRHRRPRTTRAPWTMSRLMKNVAILAFGATISFLLLRKQSKMIHWEEYQNILEPEGTKETRCFESSRDNRDERCSCPDPNKALTNDRDKLWNSNHDHMVSQAKNAPKDLDIVFFGDGMIEQLSGTRNLGAETVEGMEEYFERTFMTENGGKFNAIALGSTGDTGPNLLWHWENGIQQANLRPKLWFLMVGTNDLFVHKCTDRFVMANVLNVAQRIFEEQPDAKIVIHGIIPRKDNPDSKSNALGHLWNRAQGVNLQVRKWIKTHSSRITFMNVGQILMDNGGMKGRKYLDPTYMGEGMNPTPKGMKRWGDLVVKKVTPILKGFDREQHNKRAKELKKAQEDKTAKEAKEDGS